MKVLPRRRAAVLVNSALVVALAAGGAVAYSTVGGGESGVAASRPQTRTATVTKGTVLATVSGSGTLSSPSDAGQDFVTGGRVTAVKVAVGDAVKKGDVLATVATTDAQQQVDAAQRALTTANANLTKAEAGQKVTTTTPGKTDEKTGQQSQPTTTTTVTVDDAQVAQAEQQVSTAQTQLANAKAALAGTTLTASADGTVASVSGKVGDTVAGTGSGSSSGTGTKTTGTTTGSSSLSGFVVLTNPTGMRVTANFSELDSLKVKKDAAATVTLNAQSDTKLNAKVLSVSSLPNSSTGTGQGGSAVQYAAVLEITGDTSRLRTGLSATISVVTGEAQNALSVPTAALSGTGSARTATVVKDDGSTERVQVTVGVEGDSTVQVTEGLVEGEKVQLVSTTVSGGNGFPSGQFPGLGGTAGGGGGFGGGTGGGGARNGGAGGGR
ncbi:efflux RND transporter periplasmic adaptor subunit [Kitasatospora sp. NPDC096147]|uniref:efflux RND transporter periplasmic adaptor subunit n=1 Tax=Kitasatospora sp. NPDC096147 TaxID=3364093 RepID=UPI003819D5E7